MMFTRVYYCIYVLIYVFVFPCLTLSLVSMFVCVCELNIGVLGPMHVPVTYV